MSISISKKNQEGYPDPTAYEALTAIQRQRKPKAHSNHLIVFICSPFAGDMLQNTKRARQYCHFAVEKGAIPFAPHLHYPQFLNDQDEEQRSLGLFFGTVWLAKCDELWAFGGHQSKGMKMEIAKARKMGIPVRFFNDRCEEVWECTKP